MERKTQSGYLLLADISGYTSFVAKTEIEHADTAISYLLETIIEQLSNLLTISKLEGDAVFAYMEESKLPDGQAMLELIDHTYLAFRDRAAELYRQSTCPCKACRAIPSLDLKFMVHQGEFIIQNVAGIKDLLGTDVNLVHRLAKNHVAESTGWEGYALFTDQGLEHMHTDKKAFIQQIETYEHLGEIETYVMDMHVRYKEMKAS
jgi:class 3 adenylate cyclase